jgi:hypothetical protein
MVDCPFTLKKVKYIDQLNNTIQGRNECDQLWVTVETGEEWMWSAVCYRRNRRGKNVISCGLRRSWSHSFLPCIDGNPQLITFLLSLYRRSPTADHIHSSLVSPLTHIWSHLCLPFIDGNTQLIIFIPMIRCGSDQTNVKKGGRNVTND